MTRGEMEEVKRHFDVVAEGLRSDFRSDMDTLAAGLRGEMEEVKRHFDVVAESLRSDIRTLAEGHAAHQASIDSLSRGMIRVESRLDRLDLKVEAFRSEVSRRLDALEARPN